MITLLSVCSQLQATGSMPFWKVLLPVTPPRAQASAFQVQPALVCPAFPNASERTRHSLRAEKQGFHCRERTNSSAELLTDTGRLKSKTMGPRWSGCKSAQRVMTSKNKQHRSNWKSPGSRASAPRASAWRELEAGHHPPLSMHTAI